MMGESFCRNFLEVKWISWIRRIEYVGNKIPSSTLYICLSTLLLRFSTEWDGNWVVLGGGWLEDSWSCWGWVNGDVGNDCWGNGFYC